MFQVLLSKNNINVLKIQNISLANKVTYLKRQISELNEKSKQKEQKVENILSNFSLFKQCWKKVLKKRIMLNWA